MTGKHTDILMITVSIQKKKKENFPEWNGFIFLKDDSPSDLWSKYPNTRQSEMNIFYMSGLWFVRIFQKD